MDLNSGNIYRFKDEAEWQTKEMELRRKLVPLTEGDVETLIKVAPRVRKNNMRNKPCICGSGKKFKKCCWSLYT